MDNNMDFQTLLAQSVMEDIMDKANYSMTKLVHQIHALQVTNLKLNESLIKIQQEKQELLLQIEQMQKNTSDTQLRYYVIYGSCIDPPSREDPHASVIADSLKSHIGKHYPQWIVIDVSIQPLFMRLNFTYPQNFTYSHHKLIEFTKLTIPNINIERDKFQWIIGPHCRGYYKDIKKYYFENVNTTEREIIKLPPDIYSYLNIRRKNKYGIIDDDHRRNRWNHITNINHHKYDNNVSIDIRTNDRILKLWQNNSYYGNIKYPTSLSQNRPFLLGLSGEAFDAHDVRARFDCNGWDFHIQRTKSWPIKGCIVSDIVQGILQRDIELKGVTYHSLMDYDKLIVPNDLQKRKKYVDDVIKNKTHFCSFTVKTRMMFGHYLPDALVRHVVHFMISQQHKYCDMLGPHHNKEQDKNLLCNRDNPKYAKDRISHHLLVECQRAFKFSINMENTASYGYTSEKIYTGLIADTIPIYFGNKDIENIVSKERIIVCEVDDDFLVDKRSEFKALTREWRQKYGNMNQNKTAGGIAQKLAFEWALENYGPYVQSCVDEVIRVDMNDTLYRHKLLRPKIPNNSFDNSHYDGSVISNAIIDALVFLKSPLFEN